MRVTTTSFVLLGLAVGISLTSCRRGTSARTDSEWWQLEGDRVALVAKVKLHQIRLEKHLTKSSKSEDLISAYEADQAKTKQLSKLADQLASEISDLSNQITVFHIESRQNRRAASVGLKMDNLAGMNGREYLDIEITSVSDAGLVISHSSGIARLVAADLSKEQQFEFGIDSELSQDAIAQESRRARAYHRRVDEHTERTLAKEQLAQQKRLAEQRAAAARAAASVASTTSNNPLHQPARPVGSSSRYSSWGSRYGSYYSYNQPSSRTHYSYGSSRPTTRWSSSSGTSRHVNGTPVPTRPTPPPRAPSPLPCPSN